MKLWVRWLFLLLWALALYSVDPWRRQVTPLLQTGAVPLVLAALVDTAVLMVGIRATATSGGWSLAGRLALLYFGVKTAVVAVESVYLPQVLPLAWVPGLLFNGALTAVLLVPVAVWLFGREPELIPASWFPWTAVPWWRWPLIGALWVVLFVGAGLLVFQPVASMLDAAATAAYLAEFTPENPLAILGFQALRGMLWALLAWPFLNVLRGGVWARGAVLGLLFAGLMGSAQLMGMEYLPDRIWPAHLLEVVVENALFGLVVAWGLRPSRAAEPALQAANQLSGG